MRAVFCRDYGGPEVVSVEEAPKPAVGHGQILIRVMASSVSAADRRIRSRDVPKGFGLPMRLVFGWSRPKKPVLGTDLAGVVEAVGEGVTRFAPGDAVIANVGAALGCHAEYRVLSEKAAIVRKPSNLSFEEAAAVVFGGTTALFYLRDLLKLRSGEHVLVNGAGGAVGSAAVQIAKAMGAIVTAAASGPKRDLLVSLGADYVLDYTREPVPGTVALYDAILDCHGNLTHSSSAPGLTATGRLGLVVAGLPDYLAMPLTNLLSAKKVRAGVVSEKAADLRDLMALAEKGQFKPVISAVFPLEEARAAHEAAEQRHKTGNIILAMGNSQR